MLLHKLLHKMADGSSSQGQSEANLVEEARRLIQAKDIDRWQNALSTDDENRRQLVEAVINSVTESKEPDEISTTVKAFMTCDLPQDLLRLLESILKTSAFGDNRNLQNLLLLTALKTDPSKALDYVAKFDNFYGPDLVKIAEASNLGDTAEAIRRKFRLN